MNAFNKLVEMVLVPDKESTTVAAAIVDRYMDLPLSAQIGLL